VQTGWLQNVASQVSQNKASAGQVFENEALRLEKNASPGAGRFCVLESLCAFRAVFGFEEVQWMQGVARGGA
jgi:hypothetical protein